MTGDPGLGFPYRVDGRGRTAGAGPDEHVRDLIEQVLFTAPGERVMRPDFGSGLLGTVFEPAGSELATTTQYLVQSSLQQWLGHLLAVESVEVTADDGVLTVAVGYVVLRTLRRETARFQRGGGAP
ncbi:GPW/gp25 family protein [Streptomyces sp. NPDC001652]|uniref:GPW/gp25 family protein n=1 Tax=Streptomyces sp. NPDC001652 TaxID=3154393 RepID=UPI00331FE8C5